jgi:hypothetical protein
MTAAPEVSGLAKAFGARTVIDGIDLTLKEGTVFALLGPNGHRQNVQPAAHPPVRGKALAGPVGRSC